MNLQIQHPQNLDTVTLVNKLKNIQRKLHTVKPKACYVRFAEWIETELKRRAFAAARIHGVEIN